MEQYLFNEGPLGYIYNQEHWKHQREQSLLCSQLNRILQK